MRIIAGDLGGRVFMSPGTHRTRPMSDKVRGALFNALGDIVDLTVFDPFAGSGAISFEAISRSAASATALDIDKSAITTVVKNAHALGIANKIKIIHAGAGSWLQTQPEAQFDLVICDPPYDDIKPDLLLRLAERTTINGVAVFSLPPGFNLELPPHFELLSSKDYGDATLVFYRKVQ